MTQLIVLGIESSKSYGESILQVIYILILCIVIFVGAYYTSRLLGNAQLRKNKYANLKIVEAISVGPQKSVQLIQVGKGYALIGVSKEHITFIKEVSAEDIDINLLPSYTKDPIPFNHYMDKLVKKKASDKKDE